MASSILNMFARVADFSVGTFDRILNATGMGDLYLAMVFLALLFGFLMSNFGNAFHSGSDLAADLYSKGSDKAKSRSSKPYRLGSDHKVH